MYKLLPFCWVKTCWWQCWSCHYHRTECHYVSVNSPKSPWKWPQFRPLSAPVGNWTVCKGYYLRICDLQPTDEKTSDKIGVWVNCLNFKIATLWPEFYFDLEKAAICADSLNKLSHTKFRFAKIMCNLDKKYIKCKELYLTGSISYTE